MVAMNDDEVLARIHRLVDEEHELRNRHADEPLDNESVTRLNDLEVSLDQCWDLLRQRRAKRDAGQDPDEAAPRPEGTVEHYQQ
jgi:uncharacterized protein YajQ (UPF0234 family)